MSRKRATVARSVSFVFIQESCKTGVWSPRTKLIESDDFGKGGVGSIEDCMAVTHASVQDEHSGVAVGGFHGRGDGPDGSGIGEVYLEEVDVGVG